MLHRIIIINDINDRDEILDVLSNIYTDEDFNGNNGEEYLWEEAEGYNSNQEYVVDCIKKSDIKCSDMVYKFFSEWLDNDGYYYGKDIIEESIGNSRIFSVVVEENA